MAYVLLLTAARWAVWNQSDGQLKFSLKRVSHIGYVSNMSTGDVRIGLLGSMPSKEECRLFYICFIVIHRYLYVYIFIV